MLGKVFENLIEENRRKGLGAYYTPREIVHYMCQESLINYLDTVLNKEKILVPRKDIETFIHTGDQAAHYEAARMSGTKTYKPELPKSIETHARLMDDKLIDVTICDPAVGSGAFPVGMMNEIVRARSALTPYFNDVHERTPYFFKRHAIQDCLYGVDIDPGAVEIAKLRLWLSLVVDEEDVKQVKPLPNLDYKVVAGDSLIGFPFKSQRLDVIEKLKKRFFDETDHEKKQELKSQIDQQLQLAFASSKMSLGYEVNFDFEIYFSEVFNKKGRFDVMIANPPYVGESGHKDLFRRTKVGRLGEFYMGKMDYFYFFLHLALNMTSQNGEIAFITTNYYPTATGARKLRADFKQRASVRQLINFNELRIFESAQGQHNMVTLLRKGYEQEQHAFTCVTNRTGLATPNILMRILGRNDEDSKYFSIPQKELYDGPENYIRLNREQIDKSGHTTTINEVLDKIARQGVQLGRMVCIDQGVLSGCDYISNRNISRLTGRNNVELGDGIFVFDLENPRDLHIIDTFSLQEKKLLRPFFKNTDINRYSCKTKPTKLLLYYHNQIRRDEFSNVFNHLLRFKGILEARLEQYGENYHWTCLHRPRQESIFLSEKIVVPYRSQENSFAWNSVQWFCRTDCYVLTKKTSTLNLLYILALLNSNLYYKWLYHRGKRKGEMLELFQIPLSEIPIKCIEKDDQKPFINFVNQIISVKNHDPSADTIEWERKLDQLVYKLYGLTEDEIAIVEVESS
jgi:adenine-specific DNA-methyltransferase